MKVKSDFDISQTLLPLPVLCFREMEGKRGRSPDNGGGRWRWGMVVHVFEFPCMRQDGGHDEDLLPEVGWDVVNILTHTRRGWCDSWDFKMINEKKDFRHQCHPLIHRCN